MKDKILVTGATGNVGAEVIRFLFEKGRSHLAAVRNVEDGKGILPPPVERVVLDFARPETCKPALRGVKKLFLMRSPAISDVQQYIFPVIDAARETGVEHIVFLSLMGVEGNPVTPHYKIEKYILAVGIPYTFIRPSFFMQNLNTTHQEDIRDHDELFVPAGKGKTSFIDVRDIAEVTAKTLVEEGHLNKAYELSGSEALDYYQVAEIFTQVLGRKITYTRPSALTFGFRMKKRGIPAAFVLVMIALYTVARLGKADKVTDELEKLLGRKPTTMRKYVEDYKECWSKREE